MGVAEAETIAVGIGVKTTIGIGETAGDVIPKNIEVLIMIFAIQ